MKDIKDCIVNESRITSANVHDAILNVLMKYYRKLGVSKEVQDYCDRVREALNERNRMRNLLKNQEKKYELFLTKKYSKIFEEEKNFELNSTMGDSEKSIVPLFLFSNDEIEKIPP